MKASSRQWHGLCFCYILWHCVNVLWLINMWDTNRNNNNNNRISRALYGCNFRCAGGMLDQCSVKAWLNRKDSLKSGFKNRQRITDENCLWQRVRDTWHWKLESMPREVCLHELRCFIPSPRSLRTLQILKHRMYFLSVSVAESR